MTCFCPPPRSIRLEVRNGTSTAPWGNPFALQWFSHVGAMDDPVFARLGSWLDVGPQVFRAIYHSQYAHPSESYVDGSFSIADDEVGLSVSDFGVQ